jgi:hypothetical protein
VCCGLDCVELSEGMGDSDVYCSVVEKEGEEKGGKVSDKVSRAQSIASAYWSTCS